MFAQERMLQADKEFNAPKLKTANPEAVKLFMEQYFKYVIALKKKNKASQPIGQKQCVDRTLLFSICSIFFQKPVDEVSDIELLKYLSNLSEDKEPRRSAESIYAMFDDIMMDSAEKNAIQRCLILHGQVRDRMEETGLVSYFDDHPSDLIALYMKMIQPPTVRTNMEEKMSSGTKYGKLLSEKPEVFFRTLIDAIKMHDRSLIKSKQVTPVKRQASPAQSTRGSSAKRPARPNGQTFTRFAASPKQPNTFEQSVLAPDVSLLEEKQPSRNNSYSKVAVDPRLHNKM